VPAWLPLLSFRRLVVLALAVPAAAGLAACGQESHPTAGDGEGVYVDAGPITYQVQISRELNPYSVEDRAYLNGESSTAPKPDQEWFAVFLWAKNQSHSTATTSDRFDIVDTQGTRYYPVPVNSQVNPYVWTSQALRHGGTEPAPDSPGFFSATQGLELLFKLNTAVYSNRPLILEIYPQNGKPSSISLDL
jgi:hypothetical protein